MTGQPQNMQELHRALTDLRAHAPNMKATAQAAQDHERRLAQLEATMDIVYGNHRTARDAQNAATVATQGGPSHAPRSSAQAPEVRAHEDAFVAWLRRPSDTQVRANLAMAEGDVYDLNPRASGNTGTGAAGGFSVPEPVFGSIRDRIRDLSPMRGLASAFSVTSTGTKFLVNRNDATNAWVGETDARSDTGEPTLDLRLPTYGTVYGIVEATEELILDSAIDIGTWFGNAVAQSIAQAEGAAFVAGNGSNKPTGFLAGPTPVATPDASRAAGTLQYVPTGSASAITPDSLTDLFFALKAQHRQSATWLMSSATAAVVSKLKDADERSLWQTSLSADTPSTLLGRPVVYDENMPAAAGNAFPIAFGNFAAGYLIADSGQLRVTLDDNITKPGYVRWYVRRRVGGVIYDSEAIKLLKVAES